MDERREQLFVDAVREKRRGLWRMAFSILRSEADAEDAVSAGVERTWQKLAWIRTDEAIPAYLTRSVINAAHDELRRRKRLTPLEPLEDLLPAPEDGGITGYLSSLEEKYRLPILLKFDQELPEKEIARILRIPRGTVSSRITRGVDMIRRQMQQEEKGHD